LTFTADEVAKERKAWVREWQNALTFGYVPLNCCYTVCRSR